MDMASIQAAVGSLKAATDIGIALLKLSTTAEMKAKVVELNTQILAAQASALAANSDQFTLLQEKRDLEAEIAGMKTWNAEKERYQLHPFQTGTFAYAIKAAMQNGEPPHYICAACYQRGHKFILQVVEGSFQTEHHCPECKAEIVTSTKPMNPIPARGASYG